MKFTKETKEALGYYVYAYIDPRDSKIFYVGKGKGDRCYNHLLDNSESKKVKQIKEIINSGLEPKIDILVHGVNEATSLKIEAAIIDTIGFQNLTNTQKGQGSKEFGRKAVENLHALYSSNITGVSDKAVGFKINRLFYYGISKIDLYDATRGFWRLKKENAQKANLAFALFDGVIQEVYKIEDWFEAGTTKNTRVPSIQEKKLKRYEFTGNIAEQEIRKKYLMKRVVTGVSQNPVVYFNI